MNVPRAVLGSHPLPEVALSAGCSRGSPPLWHCGGLIACEPNSYRAGSAMTAPSSASKSPSRLLTK